ncbi:MAG: hydrolase [Actinomycetota bacterium]|nr:hydrolase [Actinomycetota bacterium]
MTQVVEVATSQGAARLHVDHAVRALGTLVLGHGAGGGVSAPDLAALARHLPGRGLNVVRVEQPWRVAGRRVAVAPPLLDRAWLDTRTAWPEGPVLVGGRSAGARVAARTAGVSDALGVVALAFPLRPPRGSARSRADELAVDLPMLVVQGESDPFGGPDRFPRREGLTVARVPGDHAFAVGRGGPGTAAEVLVLTAEIVTGWSRRLLAGNSAASPRRSRVS